MVLAHVSVVVRGVEEGLVVVVAALVVCVVGGLVCAVGVMSKRGFGVVDLNVFFSDLDVVTSRSIIPSSSVVVSSTT